MLQTGHVYVIDCFTELYMWVGKSVPAGERTAASAKAQELETSAKGKRPRPKWVSITRVIEGAEPEIFKEKFSNWPSTLPITMAPIPKGRVAGMNATTANTILTNKPTPTNQQQSAIYLLVINPYRH